MASSKICKIEGCANPMNCRGMCRGHYQRFMRHGDPLAGGLANGTRLSWLVAHKDYSDDECLAWPFSRNRNGYGYVHHGGKLKPASRAMCELVNGPPENESLQAAHSCGKGHEGCVNPKHLKWATPLENAADRYIHGTLTRAEDHPVSKLTRKQVLEIRDSASGRDDLANRYGVSRTTIWRIKQPNHWCWSE